MNKPQLQVETNTIALASLLSASYGSAAVALFFLIIDALRGDPFFTPSLMGSVLLLGSEPSSALPVRLDMLAYYSLVHFVLFAALGTSFTLVCVRLGVRARRPVIFTGGILAALSLGMVALDRIWFPGLVQAMGPMALVGANLLAAVVMSTFIRTTIERGLVQDPVIARRDTALSVR